MRSMRWGVVSLPIRLLYCAELSTFLEKNGEDLTSIKNVVLYSHFSHFHFEPKTSFFSRNRCA